jgi:hypothetical protein
MRTFGDFNQRPDIQQLYAEQRSARRQRLVAHLHRCGPRPVLEALVAIENGRPVDAVLEDFGRLQPDVFKAVGADVLPIDEVTVIDGGRQ